MQNANLTDREMRTREKKLINSFVHIPCRASLIESRYGKVPSTLKNAIFMEYDQLPKLMAEYLPEPLDKNQDFANYLRSTDNILD